MCIRDRIKSGSGLSEEEINQMVGDAEANAEDDKRLRELAEARNGAENAAYQAERQLKELGDQVDAEATTDITEKIAAVRAVLESEDTDEINGKAEELQQAFHKVSEAMYEKAQAEAAAAQEAVPETDAPDGAAKADDDVVDATVVDEEA